MAQPWTAERVVDGALARRLLRRQFPQLAAERVEPFGEGFDNTAYLVDGQWVFRFPRREMAVPWLKQELRVVPRVAPRLPVAVPAAEFEGTPDEEFPWPFMGYRLLLGTTACQLELTAAQREALAPALGRFLRALHEVPIEEARTWGALGDDIGRADIERRRPFAQQKLAAIREVGLLSAEGHAALARIVDAAGPAPARACLVHGDMYARHLLLDEGHRLAGVIDWGDVHVGSPATDLGVAYAFLPPQARAAFFAAYGDIDDALAAWARFRATYHSAAVCQFAHATADAALLREGKAALAHLLADEGIR